MWLTAYSGGILTATTTNGDRIGTNLFSVTLNEETGAYTVALLNNVLHAGGSNDEAVNASVDLTYTVYDSDSLPGAGVTDILRVTLDDDAPTAVDETAGSG